MAKGANRHNDLQYIAQLKIKAAHYLLPKLYDHRGWDLQSAAFDQSFQNVVHGAANKHREEVWVCACVSAMLWDSHVLIRNKQTFNIQTTTQICTSCDCKAGIVFSLWVCVWLCVSGNRLCHTHNSIATKQYTVTKHNRYVHNIRTKRRFGDGCGHSAVWLQVSTFSKH